MRSNKDLSELNDIEKKINPFINEDNFHYNYYLKDLEILGFSMEKFGSVNAVIRHVFFRSSIPACKFVYGLYHYSRQEAGPLTRLTLCELLEAGLFDLLLTSTKQLSKRAVTFCKFVLFR